MPLIGWAKPVPVNMRHLRHPRRDYMLVAAAGPGEQSRAGVRAPRSLLRLLPVSPVTLGEPNVSAPLAALLSRAMQLNVLLAVFNMIPIPPLDGGNVLAACCRGRSRGTFDRLRPYGFLILYALMLTGALRLPRRAAVTTSSSPGCR